MGERLADVVGELREKYGQSFLEKMVGNEDTTFLCSKGMLMTLLVDVDYGDVFCELDLKKGMSNEYYLDMYYYNGSPSVVKLCLGELAHGELEQKEVVYNGTGEDYDELEREIIYFLRKMDSL